jgi:rubredoxin
MHVDLRSVPGDLSQGIAPGTAFEELPEDRLCPECGAPKDMFELVG